MVGGGRHTAEVRMIPVTCHSALALSRSGIYFDSTSVPCIIHHTLETSVAPRPNRAYRSKVPERPSERPRRNLCPLLLRPSSALSSLASFP